MPTVDTSRLADLRTWLESHACYDVRPCRVQIGRQTWEGCEYRQDRTPPQGAPNQAPYTIHALYLLGEVRPSYRRSAREVYPWEGTDWYTAGYWQEKSTMRALPEYHPFGMFFLLQPWSMTDGRRIDYHEERPYRRLPMKVEYLPSA